MEHTIVTFAPVLELQVQRTLPLMQTAVNRPICHDGQATAVGITARCNRACAGAAWRSGHCGRHHRKLPPRLCRSCR